MSEIRLKYNFMCTTGDS